MPEKVIIIGSGPAAWAASIYSARAALKPLVFEGAVTEENRVAGTLPLGQLALTTEVENYPGFPAGHLAAFLDSALPEDRRMLLPPDAGYGVSGPELMELMRQQAVNFGTRIITEDIADVDFAAQPFRLHASDGQVYESLAVIVATGARANYLGLPSEDRFKNRGVSGCAVCDGALPRFRTKPLSVIGGGDSAIEEADYLSKFASRVYLVHRRDQLRASKIMAQRAESNPKIEILWNRVVDEVLGNDTDGVTGVRLKSTVGEADLGKDITGFFPAIGHTPNTRFLEGKLELTAKKYIRLTAPMRTYTSVEGVFAAGDVADDYYRQAITAAGTGCMAALDVERWLAAKGL
jgi:thioredoxin reductase (NADPH)